VGKGLLQRGTWKSALLFSTLGIFFWICPYKGPSNWPNWGAYGRVRGKSRVGGLSFEIGTANGSYLGKKYQGMGL
jgi:hypothetical protein